MTFKVGDSVFHQAHGVGRIVGLGQQCFDRQVGPRLYYEVLATRGTVWVPAEESTTPNAPLRFLTTKDELHKYRRVLKSSPTVLDHDRRKRQMDLGGRLKSGSFLSMCEVVRDLTALGWHKSLNEADAMLLQKVRDDLYQEWAAAAGVSLTQARQEVDDLLETARQSFGESV